MEGFGFHSGLSCHACLGGGGSGFVYLCTRLDKHQLLNIYSACSFAEHKSVRVRGHPPFCFEVVLKRFEVARLDLFIPIT